MKTSRSTNIILMTIVGLSISFGAYKYISSKAPDVIALEKALSNDEYKDKSSIEVAQEQSLVGATELDLDGFEKYSAYTESEIERIVDGNDFDKIYSAIYDIVDLNVKSDLIDHLFNLMLTEDSDDRAYGMMLSLIQSKILVDEVISNVDILSMENMESLYFSTKDLLSPSQKEYYLTIYKSSADINLYADVPKEITTEIEDLGIQTNKEGLYLGIIDFGDTGNFYSANPNTYDILGAPPSTRDRGELITWYLAFTTIYDEDNYLRIETDEKLKIDEKYSWLTAMNRDQLFQEFNEREF